MRFIIPILLAVLLTTMLPNRALAAASYPYSVTVPVTAKNLPAGSSIQLQCTFSGPGASSAYYSPYTAPTNGAFSGNLTAQANSSQVYTSYVCIILDWVNNAVVSGTNSESPVLAPGWTGNWLVKGNF